MGLFRSKKKGAALPASSVEQPRADGGDAKRKKKFPFRKHGKEHPKPQPDLSNANTLEANQGASKSGSDASPPPQQRDSHRDPREEEDLGDIPRSISTPSRDDGLLPPLPATPKDDEEGGGDGPEAARNAGNGGAEGEDDGDSLGSPCESMLKYQQKQRGAANGIDLDAAAKRRDEELATLRPIVQDRAPSLAHLAQYIQALSAEVSPDPSADLPSRALRCLFSLSEHSGRRSERIAMVRGSWSQGGTIGTTNNGDKAPPPLVPALLSFLKRCPRDSSEQYLTLLVLNNLSIPPENKRPIALDHGGAKALGRMLCEDPGCHLLVIIIVNLTFGNGALNRDLLTLGVGTGGARRVEGEDGEEKSFLSTGAEVQLVDSLGYALLLASLTADQLVSLGPIPLTSAEGVPHTPRRLLSMLFSLIDEKLGSPNKGNCDGAGSSSSPFPETARWCLSALKNLTRPGKLSPTSTGAATSRDDASAVAARAVLDTGLLPVILRFAEEKGDAGAQQVDRGESKDNGSSRSLYDWGPNTAQDAALYTLMHMASVPEVQEALRDDNPQCVEALSKILDHGKSMGDQAMREKGSEWDHALLQCLKARMALSCLLLGNGDNQIGDYLEYESSTVLAEHEVHTLLELLSHCLAGRAKEGSGGYSAATFSLKGVLHVIKCILSRLDNRKMFASTGSVPRLNALLLKAIAQYSLVDGYGSIMDAEMAEHAMASMCQVSLNGMDEKAIGFANPLGGGTFLPANFGERGEVEAKNVVTRVLKGYTITSGITSRGQHVAKQVLLRMHFLRFEGSVADLTYPGKSFPSEADFDLDEKLLTVINKVPLDEIQPNGDLPKEYIFDRAVSGREKEGAFPTGGESAVPRIFPSALVAAENLASQQQEGPVDDIAVANNIAYYADGLDVYHGLTWTWNDGKGDSIERMYSAAETEEQMPEDSVGRPNPHSPPREGFLGKLKLPLPLPGADDEPFSILGLRCGATVCGRGSAF